MNSCERCGKPKVYGKRFCSYSCINVSLEERFWAKVNKTSGCWVWIASKTEFGYGRINLGGRHGYIEKAHRLSWKIHCGNIPKGMHILHTCDIPACVNPGHLYLGTDKENGKDRAIRLRVACGEKSPLSKYSSSLIKKIRLNILPSSIITKKIASPYGISRRHIRDIVNNKTRRNG